MKTIKVIERRIPFRNVLFHPLALLMCIMLSFNARAESEVATRTIMLNGTAAGGVLSLTQVLPVGAAFVSVITKQGESAELVLNRLAEEILRSDPFNLHSTPQNLRQVLKVTGNSLTLPESGLRYCFSGTDKGFVTHPVLSVSGSYNVEKKQVFLSWVNPSEQYDAIYVGALILPSYATNCAYDVKGNNSEMWGGVILGKRGDTFSAPASINVYANSQEELDTFPFYMGIAPNWSSWTDSVNLDLIKCEQGTKQSVTADVRGAPSDKPLYQIIKTTQAGAQGGVWRRFLGLKPGHTYKVEVRLNTLAMDAITNDWAYSFHAAYDNLGEKGLSVAQLAGTAALPSGSKGAVAGRVALYKPGTTTKGNWEKRSTDYPGPGLEIKNITLPAHVTSITVWLRHSGENTTGVGMDWIRLEDVTKMLSHP